MEGECTRTGFLSKTVLAVLIFGLALRFALAPTLTYPFDVEHWAVIIQNIETGNALYELSGYFYTPVWGYVMGLETAFINLIGGLGLMGDRFTDLYAIEALEFRFFTATTTTPVFNLVMKIPLIIADLVMGYLLWDFTMEKCGDRKKADLAFTLWFLCPVVIYMSGVQVQFDVLSAIFTMLTIMLVRKDKYVLAGIMFAIAALLKFFPAFMILVLVIYVIRKNRENGKALQRVLLSVAGAVAAVVAIYAPSVLDGSFLDSLTFVTSRSSEAMWYETLYTTSMILVTLVTFIITARGMWKTEKDLDDQFILNATVILAAANMISGGPQYCIVYLPLLAYRVAVTRDRAYMVCMLAIGILSALIAFLNNSFSLLTSVAEYWGWIDPKAIVDAMTNCQEVIFALRIIVQVTQGAVLVLTFLFLLSDVFGNPENKAYKLLMRVRNKLRGCDCGQA